MMSAEIVPLAAARARRTGFASVRLSPEHDAGLRARAAALGIPVSELVRQAIEERLVREDFNATMRAIHQIGAPPVDEPGLETAS